ncbi:MAG: hypothetical protein P8N75_05250 [Ascidiaceihabitans sp.]|jgi:predicted dinucleotide-utilizing enzyme|nr:hypothetical protein [Ascidiaceihabitans sp.]
MSGSSSGVITRIYTDTVRTTFRLNGKDGSVPKNGYYELALTHPNYNALFSLGLAAAVNKTSVRIRTDDALNANEHGIVTYIVADY